MDSRRHLVSGRRFATNILLLGVVILFLLSSLVPFYWMIICSFKTTHELFVGTNPYWASEFTTEHYVRLFRQTYFFRWVVNSLIVAGFAVVISTFLGALAAYGVSRIPSRIAILTVQAMILIYLIPRSLFVLSLYNVLNTFHLLDTLPGLIMAYLSFTLPFTTWLLVGFFQTVPKELDEAALVDGCSRLGALFRVVLPIAVPGLISTTIYCFAIAWDELLYPLALIQTHTRTTLTVGIASMQQGDIFAWGQIMAANVLTAIPITIAYATIYRRVVAGLAAGSVKG